MGTENKTTRQRRKFDLAYLVYNNLGLAFVAIMVVLLMLSAFGVVQL